MPRLPLVLALWSALVLLASPSARAQDRYFIDDYESVVVVGNSFAERLAMSGYLEALIHAAHPEGEITVRQVPWSADEAGFQAREMNVPTTDHYLTAHKADVIIACFGMSESFAGPDGLAQFETDLRARIASWQSKLYNDQMPPRVVLVTPIRHEDLGTPWPTGIEVQGRNAVLAQYAQVMRRVAADTRAFLVDLTGPESPNAPGALTTDGILPSEIGCWAYTREIGRQLGWVDASAAGPASDWPAAQAMRERSWDKHHHFRLLYRPTNTEYVWGRRASPFGVVNFPPEQDQLRRMVDARQRDLWAMPKPSPEGLFAQAPTGTPVWEVLPDSTAFAEDAWTPPPVDAKGTETSLGDTTINPPEDFLDTFTIATGYVIECFASEQDFPELANPLAMTFDAQHRLWVLCAPTYPHPMPGEAPTDRLIILTDTDGDGKADTIETFADGFGIATGFAIDTDGVYVAHAPDLLFFQDTDGDGKADRREVVLSGFGMCDSHHQISAVEWAPDGGFMMHEGTFTRTGVETPWGTERGHDSAIWHYSPNSKRLVCVSHSGFPNPWGHAFDDYGASLMDGTSGGSHHNMSYISTAFTFPNKPGKPGAVINRGRPTAGNEILASRHFPTEAQGSHLTTQSIGFHGLRWDALEPSGSSWKATPMPQDLLQSSDTNFRPVVVEIGPDGALYVLDWCNPIIGHMQYSVRDPRRDHDHGRVWRIRHEATPLLDPPDIVGASVPQLLELLRLPETNTRAHARRRLQTGDPTVVLPAMLDWRDALDPADPVHDRLMLDSLWITHALGVFDQALLNQVAALDTPEVRAAAVRLARRWMRTGEMSDTDAKAVFARAAEDADMRVRLEAVVAAGYLNSPEGVNIVQSASQSETDAPMRIVMDETLKHLRRFGDADSPFARRAALANLDGAAFQAAPWNDDKAAVALMRTDVPDALRTRALDTLAGDDADARLEALLGALLNARDPDALATPIASHVLDAVDATPNAPLPDPRFRTHPSPTVRALASAWNMRLGASFDEELATNPDAAVAALSLRADPSLTSEEASALKRATVSGPVDIGAALTTLAGTAPDQTELIAWLGQQVTSAESLRLDTWSRTHDLGMGALQALHDFNTDQWAQPLRRHHLQIDQDARARGRDVYIDEIRGCVRCHGQQGEGMPGFPPLAGSAWALGEPRRAAAIVVHGLWGELEVPGKGNFNSAMAPLGAVLTDEEVADVLTFVRSSWGNFAKPVSVDHVQQARNEFAGTMPQTTAVLAAYPLASDGLFGTIIPDQQSNQAQESPDDPSSRAARVAMLSLLVIFVAGIALLIQLKRS